MSSENGKTVLETNVENLIEMEQARFKQCEIYHDRIYQALGKNDTLGAVSNLSLYRLSNTKLNRIQCDIIALTIDAVATRTAHAEAVTDEL